MLLNTEVYLVIAMVRRRALNAMMYFALIVILCVSVSYGFSGGDIYEDEVILSQDEAYKVKQTVIVHENATLTVEPGVKIIFSENATMIVHGVLVANGTETSQITFTSIAHNTSLIQNEHLFWKPYASVRLVGGNGYNEGRLEVLHDELWGTVCDDGWTVLNTRVVCRELGFKGGTVTRKFGAGTGTIWMDDVRCRESDSAVIKCAHRGFGIHDCGEFFFCSILFQLCLFNVPNSQ